MAVSQTNAPAGQAPAVDAASAPVPRWRVPYAVGLAVAGRMNPLLAAILMPVSSLATLAIVVAGMRRWLAR